MTAATAAAVSAAAACFFARALPDIGSGTTGTDKHVPNTRYFSALAMGTTSLARISHRALYCKVRVATLAAVVITRHLSSLSLLSILFSLAAFELFLHLRLDIKLTIH